MCRSVLMAASVLFWAFSFFALEVAAEPAPAEPSKRTQTLMPIVRVSPYFPPELPAAVDKGRVEIEFTLTGRGDVRNPRVIRSSDKAFESHALRAVLRWKFRPRKIGGVPLAAETARTVVTFDRDNSPPRPHSVPGRRRSGARFAYVKTIVHLSEWTAGILRFRVVEGTDGSAGENYRAFECEASYEPHGSSSDEPLAVARELIAGFIAEKVQAFEAKSGHQLLGGIVRFHSEAPVLLPSGEIAPRKMQAVEFIRTDNGKWEPAGAGE